MIKNDGGAAFARPESPRGQYSDSNVPGAQTGMSLRDYFAAKVDISVYTPFSNLTEILGRKPTVGEMAEYIAAVRHIEADAMLAERAK